MKKLTKVQKEIESLAKRLRQPNESFRKWDVRLRAKKEFSDSCIVYESFYSVVGKYAIERTFEVGKDFCNEMAQWWIDTETGKIHYRERHSSLIYGGNYGYRFRGYDINTPFEFKQKSGMEDKYGYRFVKPFQKGKAMITDALKRKGVTEDDLETFDIIKLSKALADARMETILKHSVKDFYWFMNNRELTDAVWTAYKITIRHHHRIRNIETWYDMITNMDYLGMDVHNPVFVCTKAYKRLHDDVVERANRRRERERKIASERRKREEMEQNKSLIEERMRKYSDLCISNGTLHSVVLITPNDYSEEGSAMHHCVGGYFTNPRSIILSMRDKDGNRVETVEVSLSTFSIVQSRGVCNKSTSHHDEIVDLVKENMWQIRERYNGTHREVAMAS